MSAVEEYATVHVALKTPLALGKTGSRSLLDSLLLQRLMLLHDADWDRALADMPLAHREGIWMGGGGFDPGAGRFVQRRPIYRQLLSDHVMDMAEEHLGLTLKMYMRAAGSLMGSSNLATSSQYMVNDVSRLDFRMMGDPGAVVQLLSIEPYLGPGQSCGFGEIDHVSVTLAGPQNMGWLLTDPGGRLTRPIPEDLAAHIDTALAWRDQVRIEPPYWMGDAIAGWRPRPVEYTG